jgi:hypothetical protein
MDPLHGHARKAASMLSLCWPEMPNRLKPKSKTVCDRLILNVSGVTSTGSKTTKDKGKSASFLGDSVS